MSGNGQRCHNYQSVVKRNLVERYIIEKKGKEYKITKRRWNRTKGWLLSIGYVLLRVEQYRGGELFSIRKIA